jgi:hypothetical protein
MARETFKQDSAASARFLMVTAWVNVSPDEVAKVLPLLPNLKPGTLTFVS